MTDFEYLTTVKIQFFCTKAKIFVFKVNFKSIS